MKISFDFDDTLLWKRAVFDENGEFDDVEIVGANPRVLPILKRAISQKHEVYIITSRLSLTLPEVEYWLGHEQWKVLDGIKEIIFTEGRPKQPTLIEKGIDRHYDDDPEELVGLPEGMGVLVSPHPSWLRESRGELMIREMIRSVV